MRRDDLLDLNDVLQHPGRKIEVDVSTELPEEADLDLAGPLEGFLSAISTGNLLLISGTFNTTAVLECARCSEPIEVPVDFEIDEQFPVVGVPSSLSHQDFAKVAADEPYELFDGNNLMVENLLRQALILALPIQPLCSGAWDAPCPLATKSRAEAANEAPPENPRARAELQKLASLKQSLPPDEVAP